MIISQRLNVKDLEGNGRDLVLSIIPTLGRTEEKLRKMTVTIAGVEAKI
jgi:hypothetical protein